MFDTGARAALALHCVNYRVHQPFLIWLALSWQARPRAFRKQLHERKKILEARLVAKRATLKDVLDEVGHPYHEAVWMLQLMIEQTENEKHWIDRLLKEADKRAPARRTNS